MHQDPNGEPHLRTSSQGDERHVSWLSSQVGRTLEEAFFLFISFFYVVSSACDYILLSEIAVLIFHSIRHYR